MHFCECLPTPALCLINYWTSKNLWEARALCDWAADMKKRYPPEYLTDRIEAWSDNISIEWMMVIPWNIYTWRARWGGKGSGWVFIIWGWTWCHTAHHSVILKAKQKEKKRERERQKDRKKGKRKYRRERRVIDLVIFCCLQ